MHVDVYDARKNSLARDVLRNIYYPGENACDVKLHTCDMIVFSMWIQTGFIHMGLAAFFLFLTKPPLPIATLQAQPLCATRSNPATAQDNAVCRETLQSQCRQLVVSSSVLDYIVYSITLQIKDRNRISHEGWLFKLYQVRKSGRNR